MILPHHQVHWSCSGKRAAAPLALMQKQGPGGLKTECSSLGISQEANDRVEALTQYVFDSKGRKSVTCFHPDGTNYIR